MMQIDAAGEGDVRIGCGNGLDVNETWDVFSSSCLFAFSPIRLGAIESGIGCVLPLSERMTGAHSVPRLHKGFLVDLSLVSDM